MPSLVALLTLDLTAPLELAVTRHGAHFNVGHVAPVAAHQITSVGGHRRNIALPALRAQAARAMVRVAKVGRRVRVDEVLARRRLDRFAFGYKVDPVIAGDHFSRTVVAILQPFPDIPKRGHHQPTGLHCA